MRQDADHHRPNELRARLEAGDVVPLATLPLATPGRVERELLAQLRLSAPTRKAISYNPQSQRFSGLSAGDALRAQAREWFAQHSRRIQRAVRELLPGYAGGLVADRMTFRPGEEAVRSLRDSARNDLLHVDAFSTRPSFGRRILRVYCNLHPEDERVWAVADRYPDLLERYRARLPIPARQVAEWQAVPSSWHRLLRGDWVPRSYFDEWQLRLHHAMKRDEDYQDRAERVYLRFPPMTAWMLLSDGLSHADLRGRWALEHSFFVPLSHLAEPARSPIALLAAAGRADSQPHAA